MFKLSYKKCSAPCMGYISKEEYNKQISQIISILEGKTDSVKKELKEKMDEASKIWSTKKRQNIEMK